MNFSELIPNLPKAAASILLVDFLRYFVAAGLVYWLVWRVFSRQLQSRRIMPNAPKPGQMWREFWHSMSTVGVFGFSGVCIYTLEKLGFTRIYAHVAEYGWAWWWASLLLIIVLHDAYFYWTHRLLHRPWWFAHFHNIHHQSVHPTPWAAYSFHPVEAGIQATFFVLVVNLIPLHPWVLVIFLIWMIVRNTLGHSAYELLPWRSATQGALRWCTTNSHHHFHHAYSKGNYGLYFIWWDRWMGTEDAQYIPHGNARFLPQPASPKSPTHTPQEATP